MKQIGILIVCIVLIFVAIAGLIFFLLHVRNQTRRELNGKIAVFAGTLVNKKAEGTMGHGLLYEESMGGNTYLAKLQNPAGCTIMLKNIESGNVVQKSFVDVLNIGRERPNDNSSYLLIESPDVSRQHCRLHYLENKLYIDDLGSSNKTYVNGMMLMKKEQIHSGDKIMIGHTQFQIFM